MSESDAFGIDKGIIRAFLLMVVVIGVLTTFFLSEYVAGILLGSIFYQANNGTTYVLTSITGETILATNGTEQFFANIPVRPGSLTLENASQEWGLGNFTIHYANGSLLLDTFDYISNDTSLLANYTYTTETTSILPVSEGGRTLLGNAEDDFVTTFTSVNTGVKFAAALITVVAVILVFASFLPKGNKRKGEMDY